MFIREGVPTTFSLGDLKVRSPFRAICRRELSRYFSCTIYALNSSIGMVLLLAFSVLLAFGGANAITAYAGEVDVGSMLARRSAHSRHVRQHNVYDLRLPLARGEEPLDHVFPSRALHRRVPVEDGREPLGHRSLHLGKCCAACHRDVRLGLGLALMLVVPTAYACFISTLGMYMNVRFPRYDWTSEYYAVKGGAISVLATTGLGYSAASFRSESAWGCPSMVSRSWSWLR